MVRGQALTQGISKTVSWYSPDTLQQYSGLLWEMDPVEIKATPRPPMPTLGTPTPERSVFAQEGVNEQEFKQWMKERDLSLIVVRNQTQRDRGDRQQPFNLRVPGGVQTTATNGPVYDISHFQIFQGDLVRGYEHIGGNGRRVLAQHARMPFNPTHVGPQGSVKIAQDGSSASFVPANRALSWQTTNPNGEPVVRERLWVTFQPGEIRTCSGCHGENVQHQGGGAASQQEAQALRDLLRHWKQEHQTGQRLRRNGSQPLVPKKG